MHIILILRLYGLYGSRRLAFILGCLMILALGVDLYIVIKLEPTFSAMDTGVPSVGVFCVPGPRNTFAFVW